MRDKNITLHLTDEESETLLILARIYQRKPAELARLLLIPIIEQELAQALNKGGTIEKAHFTPSMLDKLPKL